MKLTVFAATGGIGPQLLDLALAAGHDVTAVVRNPAKLPVEVRAVTADLATAGPAALEPAVAGADAVLSGLGPRSRADAGVASRGTLAIVEATRATGVRRVVVVSAAPVATVASPGRLVLATLGGVCRDLALLEDALRDRALDWTVLRPPRLTDRPLTGTYRTAVG